MGPSEHSGRRRKKWNESECHRDWKPQWGQLYGGFGLNSPHFSSGCGVIQGRGACGTCRAFQLSARTDATGLKESSLVTEPSQLGRIPDPASTCRDLGFLEMPTQELCTRDKVVQIAEPDAIHAPSRLNKYFLNE